VVATLQAALMRHFPQFPNTFRVVGENVSMGAAVKIVLIWILLASQELALCRARSLAQRAAHSCGNTGEIHSAGSWCPC